MYSNNFAAAIKVGGKVLREFNKDNVYIPFGSEYTILLKNLSTRKVSTKVLIDGNTITGGELILYAGQGIELERSIKNGNLTEGNKLKFIERTSKIENHRGIKLEDGLVRIEYQFEEGPPIVQLGTLRIPLNQSIYPYNTKYVGHTLGIQCSTSSITGSDVSEPPIAQLNCNDSGITVDGGKSSQKFGVAQDFLKETIVHNMIFKLLGETESNKEVRTPITVKTKIECPTCGTINSATSKFCSECGTGLEIF